MKYKQLIFKSLLLPTVSFTSAAGLSFAYQAKQYKSENSSLKLKTTNSDLDFNNNVENSLNLQEIVYWHDAEPEAWVTKVNTWPVSFKITSNNVIADVSNTKIANSKNATADVKQVTSFQTTGNSGSYQFDSKKEEEKRIVDWQRILGDYISYQVVKSSYSWGDATTKASIDVEKTWSPNNSINNVEGKIVYINDEVYDNKNHDFWFSRGISKDMKNNNYHVWALPYAYAKEIQYIYGVYNYVARYLYTLQVNADFNHTNFVIGTDNVTKLYNNISYLYDLSQLICIKKINYPSKEKEPAELVWGFNDEILELYQNTISFNQTDFINKISKFSDYRDYGLNIKYFIEQGKINANNLSKVNSYKSCEEIFSYCISAEANNNKLYQLFNKYKFKQSNETLKTINLLFKALNINVNYTFYDQNNNEYINQTRTYSADSLKNDNATMFVYPNNNHEYWFRINNISTNGSKEHNAYIADATINFVDDYSTDGIEQKDDHHIIKQPEYSAVEINKDELNKLKCKAPSEITKEDLINKVVIFKDKDGKTAEVQPPQYYHLNLTPDDIEGELKIEALLQNEVQSETYNEFKQFEFQNILTVSANAFSIVLTNDISDDKIWQILLSQGWINQVSEQYNIIEKDPDLRNGVLKFRLRYKGEVSNTNTYKRLDYKQVTIENFEQYYVDFVEDKEFLKTHNAKDVTEEEVRLNLLKTSDGYKNSYPNNDYCTIVDRNGEDNKIKVRVNYEKDYKEYVFHFTTSNTTSEETNNTVLIVSLCVMGVGILALVITLAVYFVKTKKGGGLSGKNNMNQQKD